MLKLAFIGAGNMSSSMVGGLGSTSEFGPVLMADRNQDKLDRLSQLYQTETAANNQDAALRADVLVLAVKPQGLKDLCLQIRSEVQEKKPLIISVAAGVTAEAIEYWLGGDLAVIRSMPNIPSKIQMGMTGLFANDHVSNEQKKIAEVLCKSIGEFIWLSKEHDMHALTAVSGSGPAYFFLFMEAMHKSAKSLGLQSDEALKLVVQTALGAAEMVKAGESSPEALKESVMSPNGTTEQAIRSFEQDGLRPMVQQAMIACLKRSETMAEELSSKE